MKRVKQEHRKFNLFEQNPLITHYTKIFKK